MYPAYYYNVLNEIRLLRRLSPTISYIVSQTRLSATKTTKANTMSNVHGLYSNQDDDSDESDNEERYVGGTDGRGGGRYASATNLLAKILGWPDFGYGTFEFVTLYLHSE